MKKLFLLFVLTLSALAEGHPNFLGYGEVGALGGYPMVGTGFRLGKGRHAFDYSGQMMPLSPRIFHLKGLYLYSPWREGFYLGAGLGLVNEPESLDRLSGSMEGALGYHWKTTKGMQMFLEADAIAPFNHSQGVAKVWPGVRFGIGF